MKRILVPTDFSTYSLKALDYALGISKAAGSEIVVLHVCDLFDTRFSMIHGLLEEENRRMENELWEKLRQIQQSVLETEKVNLTTRLYTGDITECIIEEARKGNIDLILMGTLGATGIKEKILGSKATNIIRHSPVPVLCIPWDYNGSVPQNILLAINEEPKNMATLQPLMELCTLFKVHLKVAVLSEGSDEGYTVMAHSRMVQEITDKLAKAFPAITCNTVHLSGTHFYNAILEYVKENNIDLLAMIPHQKKWLQYITGKSMTQKVAVYGDVPLLTLNEVQAG